MVGVHTSLGKMQSLFFFIFWVLNNATKLVIFVEPLEYWLNHADSDLTPLDKGTLRQLLNRAYVLLCERFGPVRSDRLLKQAADRVREQRPGLQSALHALL